jgi:hypothetical protein
MVEEQRKVSVSHWLVNVNMPASGSFPNASSSSCQELLTLIAAHTTRKTMCVSSYTSQQPRLHKTLYTAYTHCIRETADTAAARLTMVEEQRKVCVSHRLVNVNILAHHHRTLAPKLQRAGLQALCNLAGNAPADLSAASEGNLQQQQQQQLAALAAAAGFRRCLLLLWLCCAGQHS